MGLVDGLSVEIEHFLASTAVANARVMVVFDGFHGMLAHHVILGRNSQADAHALTLEMIQVPDALLGIFDSLTHVPYFCVMLL